MTAFGDTVPIVTIVNGSGIWVTDGGALAGYYDNETTEALKIDFALAEVGTYNLYAIIMNNGSGGGRWDVSTSIGDESNYINYNRDSAEITQAVASDFEGNVTVSGGG